MILSSLTPPSTVIGNAYDAAGFTPKADWDIGMLLKLDGSYTGRDVILNLIFISIGFIFFFGLVLAGWEYMTSSGDPKRIQGATTRFLNNLFGLLITFFALIIVRIALSILGLDGQNYI
jgi:hypothetical protein